MTDSFDATGMTPFKAMFGVDAFEARCELETDGEEDEPKDLAGKLSRLHRILVENANKSSERAAQFCQRVSVQLRRSSVDMEP